MRERNQRFDPRQTMQSDTFEVFHYKKSGAEDVQVHHHAFYEVYCFLDGDVEYWVEGSLYRLKKGDLLLINPMELHRPILKSDSKNYERIVQQIWCDSCEIQKISVIFAPAERLAEHPYLPPRTLRKLLKQRQLKGGWTTIEEMIDEKIFTVDEAARIAPYLRFDVQQPE